MPGSGWRLPGGAFGVSRVVAVHQAEWRGRGAPKVRPRGVDLALDTLQAVHRHAIPFGARGWADCGSPVTMASEQLLYLIIGPTMVDALLTTEVTACPEGAQHTWRFQTGVPMCITPTWVLEGVALMWQ